MAPLSLFHSISSVSSDITIFPVLDIATLELIQQYSSESPTRMTPDLAIRLTKLRENLDRGILDGIQYGETQKVRNGWALSSTADVVKLSLDSNVADRLSAEKKSRIIFLYGTVDEGSVTLSLIRRMITGCDYGHIHNSAPLIIGIHAYFNWDFSDVYSLFTCGKRRFKSCADCQTPWHEGGTCKTYQCRLGEIREIQKGEMASECTMGKSTKPCPKCKVHIELCRGCNHMTCSQCCHGFCYSCGVD